MKRAAMMLMVSALVCRSVMFGCASVPYVPPATMPSTTRAVLPGTTQVVIVPTSHPLDPATMPVGPTVRARSFQLLWTACEQTARDYNFALDREDYRAGVITTAPQISKQFFELWRNDAQTVGDIANSSIATYRRTLRFDIWREPDGMYAARPTVLIERYALAERPITASVYLRNVFRTQRGTRPMGTREADRGIYLPARYWYATGNDGVVQKSVSRHLEKKLRG